MSDTTTCTPERLLAGFATLSPEDQSMVRAKLLEGSSPTPDGPCCDPRTMMDQLRGTMNAEGADPMAFCEKMLRK